MHNPFPKLVASAVVIMGVVGSGCIQHTTSSLDSHIDPAYSPGSIRKVVVFPMTNTSITPGDAQEFTRSFSQALQRKIPGVAIMGAGEAVEKINAANLADEWATFLRNYNTSGIPNTNTVKRICGVLGVDAVIQGSVLNVTQKDSSGFDYPTTRVSIRYSAISAKTGTVLWEITAEGKIQPHDYAAAPIIDAARIAHEKILESIPK